MTLGLLVIVILGGREVAGAVGQGGLTAEERQLTATTRAARTAGAIATATALVVQPVLDARGVGDGETPTADYPDGPWTIAFAYKCGRNVVHPSFRLELYNALDSSYLHPTLVANARGPAGSGASFEETHAKPGQQFVLLETGPCAWHVRARRGRVTVPLAVSR
ncbi:MAG: hypothetical protein JOZ41_06075 [Chloroflexi bacterium]|nr:hypothetical protein [Chloroflexota bacterium]